MIPDMSHGIGLYTELTVEVFVSDFKVADEESWLSWGIYSHIINI